nr:hypothetical protein [Erwinia billingiae]
MLAGFTVQDLEKIKNNVARFGGTPEEAIKDLARRFSTLIWISVICTAIFIMLVIFGSPVKIFAGGVSFVTGITIMLFAQPVALSYKSWKVRRQTRA